VAATVVYAARGAGTRLFTRLHVADGATLVWQPEPVIVTARARHRSTLLAEVAAGGSLAADELVVLGRSGEDAGAYESIADLRLDGTPVSLTSFDTATPGWAGPAGIAGAKVVGTRIVTGASVASAEDLPGSVDRQTVMLRPEGGGAIATTLAADPATARCQLDAHLSLPRLAPGGEDVQERRPAAVGGGRSAEAVR